MNRNDDENKGNIWLETLISLPQRQNFWLVVICTFLVISGLAGLSAIGLNVFEIVFHGGLGLILLFVPALACVAVIALMRWVDYTKEPGEEFEKSAYFKILILTGIVSSFLSTIMAIGIMNNWQAFVPFYNWYGVFSGQIEYWSWGWYAWYMFCAVVSVFCCSMYVEDKY